MSNETNFTPNLPFYLTGPRAEGFLKSLDDFRSGITVNLFQAVDTTEVIQGDLCLNFLIANLRSGEVKGTAGIAISNSCDVSRDNKRDSPPTITFAPTIQLKAIVRLLEQSGISNDSIKQKISAIKSQIITDMFFLPSVGEEPERVALLSQASSMPVDLFYEKDPRIVLRLSMLGYYLLLFKVSFHFCRMHEEIQRAV